MKTYQRALAAALVMTVTAVLSVLGFGAAAQATGGHHGDDHKVVVCHAVPEPAKQPTDHYNRIVVDKNSTKYEGHLDHPKDIIGPEGDEDFQCPKPTPSPTCTSPSPTPTSPSPTPTTESPTPTPTETTETPTPTPTETTETPTPTPTETSESPTPTPSDTTPTATPSDTVTPSPSDSTPTPDPSTSTPEPTPSSSTPTTQPPVQVTTVAPGFLAPTCKYQGTVTIPPVTGVQYSLDGTPVTSGVKFVQPGTHTVTAQAIEGYVLSEGAVTTWTRTFTAPSCATTPPPSATPSPSFSEVGGGDPLPQTGGSPTGLLVAAGGLLMAGGALVLAARRKGEHA